MTSTEAELLGKINVGLPPETWKRYHHLIQRRQAEELTEAELAELIAISDRLETANVDRIANLIELASIRGKSLRGLMDDLGINAPSYA